MRMAVNAKSGLDDKLQVLAKAVSDGGKANTNVQKFDVLWGIYREIDSTPKVSVFLIHIL